MRLDEIEAGERYAAVVTKSVRITPDSSSNEVRNITLEIDDVDFGFDVGQSIGIIVPGPHEFGHADHLRLYTVANTQASASSVKSPLEICVKRCFYIDEISGERHRGIASNFLCDRRSGDQVTVAGPYGLPFDVPDDSSADMLMIGLGTGIAPFRAFVRHIYENLNVWTGKVRLFHGARSGIETLYMNDEQDDFASYYDRETFKAFVAVSPRPHMDDPIPLDEALEQNSQEVWEMILKPDTHVYVAGLEQMLEPLDKAFSGMAGSMEKWDRRKAELVAGGRWTELVY